MKRKATGSAGATKRHRGSDVQHAQATEKLYTLSDVILVLGDGDFTFSRGLVTHRSGGRNLYATSYDSESKVKAKYANAADCIKSVRASGAVVLHGVDATKLHLLPRRAPGDLSELPLFFKYIIFNFPHTGQQRVHINRALLLDFFESARGKLVKAGEVHITLKNRPPYSNWLVEGQAKAAGFALKERRKFNIRAFPGYHHRTTDPQAKKFEAELCITYVFVVNRSKYPFEPIERAAKLEQMHEADEEPQEDAVEADSAEEVEEEEKSKQPHTKEKRQKQLTPHGGAQRQPANGKRRSKPSPSTELLPRPKSKVARGVWRPLHRRGVVSAYAPRVAASTSPNHILRAISSA